jgi:hypothetical protein
LIARTEAPGGNITLATGRDNEAVTDPTPSRLLKLSSWNLILADRSHCVCPFVDAMKRRTKSENLNRS